MPHQKTLTNGSAIARTNLTLTTPIAGAATAVAVAAFDTNGYSKITGSIRSNKDCTVKVYQGIGTDAVPLYDYLTSVAVTAGTTEGAGAAWEIAIIANSARIDITNSAGADLTTLSFQGYLRSLT